ncbi:unnamed protein product [Albugo candida]|uniref:Peptidase A1 domain-containing protein n=1 Tax=Albugo candida TaxID=65357 RepID=A0A024FX71_9STRA|nr:unnamed protein product [Albugo candida]|eukprot:CCI11264.1 unnamed protein product [Albugo candida]
MWNLDITQATSSAPRITIQTTRRAPPFEKETSFSLVKLETWAKPSPSELMLSGSIFVEILRPPLRKDKIISMHMDKDCTPHLEVSTEAHNFEYIERKLLHPAIHDRSLLLEAFDVLIETKVLSINTQKLSVHDRGLQKLSYDIGRLISEVPQNVYDDIRGQLDTTANEFSCKSVDHETLPRISIEFFTQPRMRLDFTSEEYVLKIPNEDSTSEEMCTLALATSTNEDTWIIGATFTMRYSMELFKINAGFYMRFSPNDAGQTK